MIESRPSGATTGHFDLYFFIYIMLTLMNIIIVSILFIPKCITKDYCSVDYCNNSKQHTLCKYRSPEPASHCVAYEKTILSENERRILLDKINSRRNKVATGEIRSLPSAGSMLKLEWNKELEISAQRWADQCVKHSVPDKQDTCRDLGKIPVGQNIATIHGDAPGLTPLALVDVWYMELLNVNSSILSRYVPSSETTNSHYDYFTQLMWEETHQVGCGGVKFKERLEDVNVKYRTIYRLVCNFAPAGNVRNRSVYASGLPCSRCPLDATCDLIHKALCYHKSIPKNLVIDKDDNIASIRSNVVIEHTPKKILPGVVDMVTETIDKVTSDTTSEKETFTQFDYFSHLYEYTKQMITSRTKPHSCKDVMAVDDFIELLKKKLSNDPMIKDLLSTNKSTNSHGESSFNDVGVAAFVDRVYSKKEPSTTRRTVSSDYVNSTFLVDLIEAVIFRNGDKMPVSEGYSANTQSLSSVKPIMVQAELAEIRQNDDFTGHYFFPEENEESNTESTDDSYYDDINLPVSDLALEDFKMSTVTKDFLDDIIEPDTSLESTTTLMILSPDNINLYKTGQSVMKKFLQNIVDKPRVSQKDDYTILNINVNTKNNNREYFEQQSKRNRRSLNHSRSDIYKNNECTYELGVQHKKNIEKKSISHISNLKNSKRLIAVSYKGLVRQIATDLKKLKLNERFSCSVNRSTTLTFKIPFHVLLLYISLN